MASVESRQKTGSFITAYASIKCHDLYCMRSRAAIFTFVTFAADPWPLPVSRQVSESETTCYAAANGSPTINSNVNNQSIVGNGNTSESLSTLLCHCGIGYTEVVSCASNKSMTY